VFVSNKLPLSLGVSLVSSSSSIAGATINQVGSTLTWNVGNLATNAGGTLSLTFMANALGTYTNGATVYASTVDPNPDDDSVGASITVVPSEPPALSFGFAPLPGGGTALQLSVTNDVGLNIIVQASTNLVNWIPISTNVAPFTLTNLESTNFPERFYRAVTTQ
jgi:hypothetical protein